MKLNLKLHYQYDETMTLCTRRLWNHQIKLTTTDLFRVDCSHCFRRIMKGEVPHQIYYGSYEQPIEYNPRSTIIADFERKYGITLASDQRESLFEDYGVDEYDEELAAKQLDVIMEKTLRAMK